MASATDVFNHREHGEDCIFTVVDERRKVTGIQFIVQNKVVPKNEDTSVRARGIKIETIERLVSLGLPILLHAYTGTERRKGKSYWLWLDEWYIENKPTWKPNQQEVTVTIPSKNTLNKKSLKEIIARITWEHQKREAVHKADLISRISKNYLIKVDSDSNSITTIIHAKNEDAIPRLVAQDEESDKAMRYVIENGLPVNITGKFSIQGPTDLEMSIPKSELIQAILLPIVPNEMIPVCIEYFDKDDQILFKTDFVMMQLVQPGTVNVSWQGQVEGSNTPQIIYRINENTKEQTRNFNVNMKAKSYSIAHTNEFFDWWEQVRFTSRFQISKLGTNEIFHFTGDSIFDQEYSFKQKILRTFAQYLSIIESGLGITLTLPTNIDDTLFQDAFALAKIIVDGYNILETSLVLPEGFHLIVFETVENIRELINFVETGGQLAAFRRYPEDMPMEFMGHKFHLGPAKAEFSDSRIANFDILRGKLKVGNLPNDAHLMIAFEVQATEAKVVFDNWTRQKESEQPQNE
ncbi:MAG: DUF4365 domain-containing protein [Chloroflexota bacterium]